MFAKLLCMKFTAVSKLLQQRQIICVLNFGFRNTWMFDTGCGANQNEENTDCIVCIAMCILLIVF